MAKTKEKIKLTRAEKKQLQALMKRNQQQNQKGPHTAQDTIPYQRMWPDGVCRVLFASMLFQSRNPARGVTP